jgi:hypothetical protein
MPKLLGELELIRPAGHFMLRTVDRSERPIAARARAGNLLSGLRVVLMAGYCGPSGSR